MMHSIDGKSIDSLLRCYYTYCTVQYSTVLYTIVRYWFFLRKHPSAMTVGKRTSTCKVKASRENDNTVSVEAWYDPTHGRLGGTIWVPKGESTPDINALVSALC